MMKRTPIPYPKEGFVGGYSSLLGCLSKVLCDLTNRNLFSYSSGCEDIKMVAGLVSSETSLFEL
jgi:hypothetical protein